MEADTKKRIEEIHKLLRRAAKSNGNHDEERTMLALLAADLFVELEDHVRNEKRGMTQPEAPTAATPPATPMPPAPSPSPSRPTGWYRSVAPRHFLACQSSNCGRVISINERIWRRVNNNREEFLHEGCPRSGETSL